MKAPLLALSFLLLLLILPAHAQPHIIDALHKVPRVVINGEERGSAVVVSENGYLATCRHVVGDSPTANIHFYDGSVEVARIMRRDNENDLAILYFNPGRKLKYFEFPTKQTQLTDEVFVIGHPRNKLFSISKGIISGSNRRIPMPAGDIVENALQTDAAINPGNSGGACIDMDGKLVGIVFAYTSEAQNMGYVVRKEKIISLLTK